jgi:hypothetical protein
MTNVGRNMQCAYTSVVEEILKFKTLESKLRVRWLAK